MIKSLRFMSLFPIGSLHVFRNHKKMIILAIVTIVVQRVKVYRLNEDGQWDDKGTGHITMDYMEVCSHSWIPPAGQHCAFWKITCS